MYPTVILLKASGSALVVFNQPWFIYCFFFSVSLNFIIKKMNIDNGDNFRFLPLLAPDKNQGRIIHVTHQIPFQVSHDIKEDERLHWSFTSRHGHAAMYAGMHSLIDEWETICIGWTGKMYEKSLSSSEDVNRLEIDESTLSEKEKVAMTIQLQQEHNCIPLFLDGESIAGHYHGYCKTCMYFIYIALYIM
jgi:trehalose 6-phosphate synthase/phosphatase